MGKKRNRWLWLMMPEDSTNWESSRSNASNRSKKKSLIPSIGKVLFWYGAALSLTLLIAKLH